MATLCHRLLPASMANSLPDTMSAPLAVSSTAPAAARSVVAKAVPVNCPGRQGTCMTRLHQLAPLVQAS